MTNEQLQQIADNADMIISGYAFTRADDGFIRILDLNSPASAMVVDDDCELIETNMDEIEQNIVLDLCKSNLHFMGRKYA